MSGTFVFGALCIIAGVLVSVFHPLYPIGAAYGPGWGDVVNGGAGLLLLLLGGVIAVVGALRRRKN